MWLRASENGIQFLVSVKRGRIVSRLGTPEFIEIADSGHALTIKSFEKKRDSGIYNCGVYIANTLTFGTAQLLEGKPEKIPTKKPETFTCKPSTVSDVTTTPAPCVCPTETKREDKRCELLIWAPLAGGCGLLLLLLITVSIICNHRTVKSETGNEWERETREDQEMTRVGN
ncbi:T-cell surface glycoprotein CD8 alpha chain-like [Engraulis encrasicolus]|uniref:T-cell surface glycoprotein CD8 alpha chain-like n=1 Tax=Engraulis encrasicolus TaxID=184585 RepID=UPI002FD4613E